MDVIVTGKTAFNYWRTPPQVLMGLPSICFGEGAGKRRFPLDHPAITHSLKLPLHVLTFDHNSHTGAASIKQHLWSGELPSGAICDSEFCGQVTTPLFTLLTMANALSEVHLTMAMYEMCGNFAVYKPAPEIAALLSGSSGAYLGARFGWQQVVDTAGNPTSLWRREPLIELDDLRQYARSIKGLRGCRAFANAAAAVTGVCASPFEVQASLLLGLPRARGGWGMPFENNKVVRLNHQAKQIALKDYCVADLYFKSPDGSRVLDVECQGSAVHASQTANVADAERTTALRVTGVDVAEITYAQLRSEQRFNALVKYIHKSLGITLRPKTERQLRAEHLLRSSVFIDWTTLV